jgi:hypothetical protein
MPKDVTLIELFGPIFSEHQVSPHHCINLTHHLAHV